MSQTTKGSKRFQEDIATLLGLGKDIGSTLGRFENGAIELGAINVLRQPRATFDDIDLLAENIRENGLLHPLTVARFNREDCASYLEVINQLWGTNYALRDMRAIDLDGDPGHNYYYYVLLAGERRYRAFLYLEKEGRLESRDIRANLCLNIRPLKALSIQFSENTYRTIPPYEEARAYNQFFRLFRMADPVFPRAAFARIVGRSPETVKNTIRFCDLPEEIQDMVKSGHVSYGIAVELARLQEAGLGSDELMRWLTRAILGKKTVAELHNQVTKFLNDRNSGQTALFELSAEEEAEGRRRIVERETINILWSQTHYFQRVLGLFDQGLLGKKDSPFSKRSPLRKLRAEAEGLKRLLPHLQMHVPDTELEEISQTIEAIGVLTAERLAAVAGAGGESDYYGAV